MVQSSFLYTLLYACMHAIVRCGARAWLICDVISNDVTVSNRVNLVRLSRFSDVRALDAIMRLSHLIG